MAAEEDNTETQTTETPVVATTEATTTPAESSTPAAQAERFVPAPRFDAVVAQKYEAIRKAEVAEARARDLESRLAASEQARSTAPQLDSNGQPVVQPQRQPAADSRPDIARLASIEAQNIRFAERCNESVAEGRKAYSDFDAKIDALRNVAPTIDANGRPMLPQTLVEAALETGHSSKVLYALGSDPSEADRIMSLPPMKQAIEIAKFASKFDAKSDAGEVDPLTQAVAAKSLPDPIRPRIAGSGRAVSVKDMPLDDPKLPIEEFMARRDKEAATNRRSNGRYR